MSQANYSKESILSAKTIIACALVYSFLFYANDWLTSFLEAAPGVNWIYLPAGLRLFLVLIFGLSGALGIAIASTLITFGRDLGDDMIGILGIGLISGFSPYLARLIVIHNLKINPDLSNLNIQIIAISVLVFALLSTGLHQVWFVIVGIPSGSLSNAIAMLIGDILGALLFISICKFGIDLYKKFVKGESLP
ncbi:hypothetical protein PHIN6_04020 [Polynucleobacter sp. HIN6]|uniref:hypothetical protein n=1 Tax=Polynucleobacter sp. HIN6 TaxID=3047865 RepID=UPI00257427BB|nr:hypothetical protein [Polynucleobacter sp. HIN6]BEI34884.1 hypothetical protein PHIN6_04020 [Polynucleobacter sp. HIN6]